MSYITHKSIIYPNSINIETQTDKNLYDMIWISGNSGTWFCKYNRQLCKISIVNSNIGVGTAFFYNFLAFYSRGYFRNWFPLLNSELSLLCVLLKRMLIGAGVGFKKYLRVRGVGYKFELLRTNLLTAKVGYTHLVKKQLPSEFSTNFSRKAKVVRFRSKSLTKITCLLSRIRAMRLPDVYKGKGIRYKRDPIKRKPGKRKTKAVSKKRKILKKHDISIKKRRITRKKKKTRLHLFNSKGEYCH